MQFRINSNTAKLRNLVFAQQFHYHLLVVFNLTRHNVKKAVLLFNNETPL